MLRGSNKIC